MIPQEKSKRKDFTAKDYRKILQTANLWDIYLFIASLEKKNHFYFFVVTIEVL